CARGLLSYAMDYW
nr:immunoglobulin heavy chain junction region [Mus musculus]MBK4184654.1 immunoglobulin heavy chain junction region [Mus musculus]MBK4184655.1 immunoglobulin heavy chain junction region [Mus musculus]